MASRDLSPSALRLTQEFAPGVVAPPEPRSFAGLQVKVDPITTTKPTNADLAHGFNQLHACHEDTKATVEKIAGAMGLEEGAKRAAGLSTPWQAFLRTTLAVTTSLIVLAGGYRFIVAVAPSFWALIKAANAAILAGKL